MRDLSRTALRAVRGDRRATEAKDEARRTHDTLEARRNVLPNRYEETEETEQASAN